jgi:predicted transcriptional regulator
MKTYQITLPDDVAAALDRLIAAGRYESADALLLEAVLDRQTQAEEDAAMTDAERESLRKAIQVGIDQADRGELVDAEEFMENLLAKLQPAEQPS